MFLLICCLYFWAVAVPKGYSLCWSFDTAQGAKYANVNHQEKYQKVQEFKKEIVTEVTEETSWLQGTGLIAGSEDSEDFNGVQFFIPQNF